MNTARTSLFMMANLGSEVSKILSSKERGDTSGVAQALKRAGHMLAQVQKFPDMQSRLPEIERLAEVINACADGQIDSLSRNNLESYFRPFALRLLSQRAIEA